ncbi:uncharacterized protein LOC144002745 isoform X2 [Festucalex cinctus]
MLRRSIRLAATRLDNESDPNFSYRENLVKIFKKKAGNGKRAAAGPSNLQPPPTIHPANSNSVAPVAPAVGDRHRIQRNSALCGMKGECMPLFAVCSAFHFLVFFYFLFFADLLSTLTGKINHVTTFAYRSFIGAQTMKVFIGLILLFVVAPCVWRLLLPELPFSTSTILGFIKAKSETNKLMEPLLPNIILPPPNTSAKGCVSCSTLQDSVTFPTDQEAKLQGLMREEFEVQLQRLRNNLMTTEQVMDKWQTDNMQMREEFDVEMQNLKGEVKTVESNIEVNLDQITVMSKRMDDQEQHFQSLLGHSVSDKVKALENQIAELSKELLSIQSQPPVLPYPDISALKQLTPELQQAMKKWLTDHMQGHHAVNLKGKGVSAYAQPFANKMSNFALESQGARVISNRCSETYGTVPPCLTLFGFTLWCPKESPRTVIRADTMLLPDNCWSFRGAQGSLAVALSHPIRITHVTLDHVPRQITPTGRIDSAPKDFEVYGLKDEVEEGTLLGTFTYDKDGEPTQTFELPPSDVIYHMVELRVLSNWGHMEVTCIYRFRVHGTLA